MSTVTALMYHDVRDAPDYPYKNRYQLSSYLNTKTFEAHLESITRQFKVIRGRDASRCLQKSRGKNCAVLTFDDGLKDHIRLVPLLKKYKCPATFLVPAMPALSGRAVHSHKIQFLLACVDHGLLVKLIVASCYNSIQRLQERDDKVKCMLDKYRQSRFLHNVWPTDMVFVTNFLRDLSDTEVDLSMDRKQMVDWMFDTYVTTDEKAFVEDFYMNAEDIRNALESGIEIGAHGDTSDPLCHVKDKMGDIARSLEFVRSFGVKDVAFSYPHGYYDQEAMSLLQSEDVYVAYTTCQGSVAKGDGTDMFAFPRYDGPNYIQA